MNKKFNRTAETSLNTGFGDNASNHGGRFLNKSGNANIKKTGLRIFEQYSWFHCMLAISWLHFFLLMLLFLRLLTLALPLFIIHLERPLDLELSKINALNLSWTVMHPINEKSPFFQLSDEDIRNLKGEVMIFIKVFDDMFSNIVVSRTSYIFQEIIYGAKFLLMYHRDDDNSVTILDLEKINSFEKEPLSVNP